MGLSKARKVTNFLDQFLEEGRNVTLKQLVWTTNPSIKPKSTEDPEEFIVIATIALPAPNMRHLAGMRRIELRRKTVGLTAGDVV